MGPRVHVHALDGFRGGSGAGRRLAHVRRLQPGRLGGCRELAAELAEHQVLAAILDETEGRGIPEGRRAAVAGDDLVAVRGAEELAELRAHLPDEVLHRCLTMRGAEQRRAGTGERLELLAAHLGRSAAEASVGGQDVTRELDVGHGSILGSVPDGRSPRFAP